jgi:drug/metabolite transporter (DMT)-like permease
VNDIWLIFLFAFFILGATNALLRRVLAQKFADRNLLVNGIFYVFFLAPAAVALMLIFPPTLSISPTNLALCVVGSLMWPLFNIAAFRASKSIDAGIYTIIANLSPLFTLMVAVPFMGEQVTGVQYLGIGLLMISGVIAVVPGIKNKTIVLSGVLFALLSTVILGFGVAYEKFMLDRLDLGTYILFGWGSQIMWMALLATGEWKYLPYFIKQVGLKTVLFYGSANALKSCCFILALFFVGSASIMSGATEFISIVIIAAAFFILHERDHIAQKIIGAIIGIIGLVLLTW